MDPIANMFSQIKNAIMASKKEVIVPYSKAKFAILGVFKKENLIEDFSEIKKEDQKYPAGIEVKLKFRGKESVFTNIKRISRPGRRVYVQAKDLSIRLRGRNRILVSTSSGVMSGYEARKKGLGGEIICEVN